MIRRFGLLAVVALLGVAVACGGGGSGEMESMDDGHDMAEMAPGPTTGDGAPMFEVDPFWPKPMPNNWLLGSPKCILEKYKKNSRQPPRRVYPTDGNKNTV